MSVLINKDTCIGCGICAATCPSEAIELVAGTAKVNDALCTECGECTKVCPVEAISLPQAAGAKKPAPLESTPGQTQPAPQATAVSAAHPSAEQAEGEEAWHNVWVVIEYAGGKVAPVSWELLGEGRKLADAIGCKLCGCLIGYQLDAVLPEIFSYGAEAVYLVDDPTLENYRTEPYTTAMLALISKYKPEIILMGATSIGRDVFPAVATHLKTGLTADCTVLEIDPETKLLRQTRPAFGGNIMATILCRNSRPQMATVRPRVMAMPAKTAGTTGEIFREPFGLKEEEIATKVLEVLQGEGKNAFLDKAEIIVSVGLGIGSAKNMEMVENLADVLGAAIAGTRGAVEAGWIKHDQQIGQTGITVRPKVYIAMGISGAIQHLVGMETADCIIAINNDPEAGIFRVANYGIVGDLFQVVPALTEEFKKRMQYGLVK